MAAAPLVSVVMPVHNGAAFLPFALASIDRQNRDDLEIIVVDDGSSDGSATIAHAHPNTRCISQQQLGISEAMNNGIRTAKGSLIAFLDADDWWPDRKLALQIGILAQSSAKIVVGHVQPVRLTAAEGRRFEHIGPPGPLMNLGSAVFRRDVFDEVGFFAPELHVYGDWDWFLRARELSVSMLIHPETALYYLRHEQNATNHRRDVQAGALALFRRAIARRRANPGRNPPQFDQLLAQIHRRSGLDTKKGESDETSAH